MQLRLEPGKGEAKATPVPSSGALVANTALKSTVSLGLLFPKQLALDVAAITRSLRAYDVSMANASCEIDAQTAGNGTPVGLMGWGNHVIRVVGFNVPMPKATLLIPMLYAGFVKLDVEGLDGVWMRTYGNHVLGLPDLAFLAKGHHEGNATFEMISGLLAYLMRSGAQFAAGHSAELGSNFVKFRVPSKQEYLRTPALGHFVFPSTRRDEQLCKRLFIEHAHA